MAVTLLLRERTPAVRSPTAGASFSSAGWWCCAQNSLTTAALAKQCGKHCWMKGAFTRSPRTRRGVSATHSGKGPAALLKGRFSIVCLALLRHFDFGAGDSASTQTAQRFRGLNMVKILTALAASLAMLSAAAAPDLPRKEPPPPAPPVGKAPIGKYPVGKAPIGKYPQPVVTKG